ncbi:MAG: gamma carbonic anhydrase family protein [Bacteroidota bacterium]
MALIKKVRNISPQIGRDCFLAETAVIIGDVKIGNNCSIWYNTVLRGDVNSINIGNNVNIQDGAVLHTLFKKSTIQIGDKVSIAHNVTIHGAEIHDFALIGIGATILDHAVIGKHAIIAANSLVKAGTEVEPYSVYAGIPAKKIKDVDPEQSHEMNERIANNYVKYAGWYKEADSW